jgi:hypothetical protein
VAFIVVNDPVYRISQGAMLVDLSHATLMVQQGIVFAGKRQQRWQDPR